MRDDVLSRKFPFIAGLSDAARKRLNEASKSVVLQPRTGVISRGDKISGAYLVTSGSLRIYYVNADGREGTLYWVDPGQSCILAMNCLFSELNYPAWVASDDKETGVTFVAGEVYRALFLEEQALQKFTFETMSSQLFNMMSLLEETASLGLEQRVAGFLLRRVQKGDGVLDITHDSVARHLGSAREVVSRVLRNLQHQNAIALHVGRIEIIDADKLQRIAHQT